MRVLRREEGVVVIELAHGDPVGPGCPFGAYRVNDSEHGAAAVGLDRLDHRVGDGLPACGGDRRAAQGRDGNRGIVDDAVDDHVGHGIRRVDLLGRDLSDLPCELLLARQVLVAAVNPDLVCLHALQPTVARRRHGGRACLS